MGHGAQNKYSKTFSKANRSKQTETGFKKQTNKETKRKKKTKQTDQEEAFPKLPERGQS